MNAIDPASHWYRLSQVKGIGPKRLHLLHDAAVSAGVGVGDLFYLEWPDFQESVPGFSRPLYEAVRNQDMDSVCREYERLLGEDVKLVHLEHNAYPQRLSRYLDGTAPAVLYCKGNLRLLTAESVAIVGSRNAGRDSLVIAHRLAGELALAGTNVVSGYARGIDSQSHLGALSREGTTTMVYSAGILEFARKLPFPEVSWGQNVLGVSQFPPRERWSARNAMTRNQIVCALASAVIVVEAGIDQPGKMSGTMDAGRTALKLGIPLFVLAPAFLENRPSGNRELIKLGGIEVRAEDAIVQILRRNGCEAGDGSTGLSSETPALTARGVQARLL